MAGIGDAPFDPSTLTISTPTNLMDVELDLSFAKAPAPAKPDEDCETPTPVPTPTYSYQQNIQLADDDMSAFLFATPCKMLVDPPIIPNRRRRLCLRHQLDSPVIPPPPRIYGSVLTTDDVMGGVTSVHIYGPLKWEIYEGFRGETHRTVGGRITWATEPRIPREKCFVIHLFVDVSGSMGCGLMGSQMSRLEVIRTAIHTMRDTLKPLVGKGLNVRMSLHTFSNSCEEKVGDTELTMDYLETMDWSTHLLPDRMTNIWDTVRVAKEMRDKPIEHNEEHVYILLSDGEQTVSTNPVPEKVFDYAIGIGTSHEYDATVLTQITKAPIEGCPDTTSLSATLLRLGCGSYMMMAKDVNVVVGKGRYATELEVAEWVCGSSLVFACRVPNDVDVLPIRYSMESPLTAGVDSIHLIGDRVKRTCRLITNALVLQEEARCDLVEMEGEDVWDEKKILSMTHRLEHMCQRFATDTWVYRILDGMRHTWKMLEERVTLPAMDRGCSLQSAIRQTSANYYDVQTTSNINCYSQQAF